MYKRASFFREFVEEIEDEDLSSLRSFGEAGEDD